MGNFRRYQDGFRKLIVWQEAHKLTLMVYSLTASFPEHEKFGITAQMRKAASSVSANIAEGSGRKTTKGQNNFYNTAKSSLMEVDNFAELAHDLGYLTDEQYHQLLEKINKVGYLLLRLINRKT
jgi:four helix bundle protein